MEVRPDGKAHILSDTIHVWTEYIDPSMKIVVPSNGIRIPEFD